MEITGKRMQTCCFTGHRQMSGDLGKISDELERVIVHLYQKGVRYYGAGGALGFDTLAAQTVIRLRESSCPGIKLILVLPCLTQTRGWNPEDVMEYERIKSRADKTVHTAQQYTSGCMHKRNRHLVNHSSVCVCYLTKGSGGTAYTVRYAKEKGLEIINIAQNEFSP